MSSDRPRVAAFDVDGTLTTRDCVVPFLRRVAGTPQLSLKLVVNARHTVPALVRRDRNALKEASARAAFRHRSVREIGRHAAEFARMVHTSWLEPQTLEMLRAHQAAGDTVLLVSASFEVYLRPLGGLLAVDDVLAVRLEVGPDRTFTGDLSGQNCRGAEKVRRVHTWLDEHYADVGGRQGVHLSAYGDSVGDRELLLDANTAVFVGKHQPSWLPASA